MWPRQGPPDLIVMAQQPTRASHAKLHPAALKPSVTMACPMRCQPAPAAIAVPLAEDEDGSDGPQPPEGQTNKWLRWWGQPESVCRDIVNPGFRDPWDARTDITLDHPDYQFFGWHLQKGERRAGNMGRAGMALL